MDTNVWTNRQQCTCAHVLAALWLRCKGAQRLTRSYLKVSRVQEGARPSDTAGGELDALEALGALATMAR